MAIVDFPTRTARGPQHMARLLAGHSVEVMPRTAAKVADFRALLPAGTPVYIAHIDGTPIADMLATAARIAGEGFPVVPHFPARSIPDAATLDDWLARYRDAAGIERALVLAGGRPAPVGAFASSMELLETGLFDRHGIARIDVAGHPEGNRDIDADGGHRAVDAALAWKQAFAERSGAEMSVVTQFAFDAAPVIAWAERLEAAGIDLPIRVGIAGPAKLQTLLKYAIACGVGPSLQVLQKRARDVTRLVRPFTPEEMLGDLAADLATRERSAIAGIHVFPLGGLRAASDWIAERSTPARARA